MSFGDDDQASEQIKQPVAKLIQSSRFIIEEDDESNADEMQDEVGSLPGQRVTNELFDSTLESKDNKSPMRSANQTQKSENVDRGSTVKDLMNRATNLINMQRKTLLNQSSNRKDFDYLNIRRNDHKEFKKVNKIL